MPTLRPGEALDLDHLAGQQLPRCAMPLTRPVPPVRFLPQSGPGFNPIEQACATLKAFLRAARPRNLEKVCDLIATALTLVTPDASQTTCDTSDTASLRHSENALGKETVDHRSTPRSP